MPAAEVTGFNETAGIVPRRRCRRVYSVSSRFVLNVILISSILRY